MSVSSTCEEPGCATDASHEIIATIDGVEHRWSLCRPHDRAKKKEIVRSRAPFQPEPAQPARPNVVQCAGCGRTLDEASNAPRVPCPNCGGLGRNIFTYLEEATLAFTDEIRTLHERPGVGTLAEAWGGASFTRDLGAWGKVSHVKRPPDDSYEERIELYDGTEIVSRGVLSKH